MTISSEQVLPALLRRHFPLFLQFAFRELGGAGPLKWNFHIDAIIHRLELIQAGESQRQIIALPPRHLKSLIFNAWTAWMLGNDPSLRFICASYGDGLAEKHAGDCMRLIQAPWFQRAFPGLRLVRKAIGDFETSRGGYRLATSVGGMVTGRGANYILIDDPMKADEALSEKARKAVIHWYESSLQWRLDSQDSGSIVIIMQRLHEDDLAGHLLRTGEWNELRLASIAPADELIEIGHGRFHQRREGHALHPDWLSLIKLQNLRARHPYYFAAQMNGDPVPLEGNWVKAKWFKTYDNPPATGLTILSLDTASKDNLTSDYSVGIVARFYQNRFYILDVVRERLEFGALKALTIELCHKYKVERLLIEDASSGQQLIQMLKHPTKDVPWPIACKPNAPKEVRFHAQASRIQPGEVLLPRAGPWLAEFVAEICAFPGGRYDDQADALSQLLCHGAVYNDSPVNAGPILYCDGEWFGEDGLVSNNGRYQGDPWGAG